MSERAEEYWGKVHKMYLAQAEVARLQQELQHDILAPFYTHQEHVYLTYRQTDMTEGRGHMEQFGPAYTTEQAAWDAVNELGGVMGRFPGSMTKGEAYTWQEYKAMMNHSSDYDVRSLKVVS